MRASKCQPTDLVPLRGKKLFAPRPQNRPLVPFRSSFQKFQTINPVTSFELIKLED